MKTFVIYSDNYTARLTDTLVARGVTQVMTCTKGRMLEVRIDRDWDDARIEQAIADTHVVFCAQFN